jgi:hypothetical protein
MTPQQKYDALISSAYTTMVVPAPENERIIIADSTPPEVRGFLINSQHDIVDIFNLSYEIGEKAASVLSNFSLEEVAAEDFDTVEACRDCASVYTAQRLSWLCVQNENEIMDIIKEYDCADISTACAIWYDQKAEEMLRAMIEFIKSE